MIALVVLACCKRVINCCCCTDHYIAIKTSEEISRRSCASQIQLKLITLVVRQWYGIAQNCSLLVWQFCIVHWTSFCTPYRYLHKQTKKVDVCKKCWRAGSNRRPWAHKTHDLPTDLRQLFSLKVEIRWNLNKLLQNLSSELLQRHMLQKRRLEESGNRGSSLNPPGVTELSVSSVCVAVLCASAFIDHSF